MKVEISIIGAAYAALSIIAVVIASWVGIYNARKISHEHLSQAIEDMQDISNAKDERIGSNQREIESLRSDVMSLTEKVGTLNGQTEYLLRRSLSAERYCDVLVESMTKAGMEIPPKENWLPK